MIDLSNAVAYDTETYLIAPGRVAPPLVCMTMFSSTSKPQIFDKAETPSVAAYFMDPGKTLVGQNIQFDMAVLAANYPEILPAIFEKYDRDEVYCTKIHELLLKISTGEYKSERDSRNLKLSLGDLVLKYLNENVEGKKGDVWRFKYRELVDTPLADWPADATEYALKDAWYTYRVAQKQFQLNGLLPDQSAQTRYAFALHLMACRGMITDAERVADLDKNLNDRLYRANQILVGLGFKRENPKTKTGYSKNTKDIAAEVEDQCYNLGIEPQRTGTGKISANKDALGELSCMGQQDCDTENGVWCDNPMHILKEISADEGEVTKYLEFLKRGTTEVINPRISTCLSTGRTSFSKPPLQQMPRRPGVRECFIPRPGYYFIGADYSANELVTLAQNLLDMFGHSKLAELLIDGKDPHLYAAAMLMDISYEEATKRKKEKKVKDFRQLCKALNFGLPGGLGAKTFVKYARGSWGVKITEEQAREYKAKWLSWFPEIELYFDHFSQMCNEGHFQLTQPVSGRLRGDVGYCDGCNSGFQGLAADMIKDCLWDVTKACYADKTSPLYGTRPVLLMHDEIIAEAPIDLAAEAAEELSRMMVVSGTKWCPDVPSKAEPWMSDRWYKDAETVRDYFGNLMLWNP